MSLRHGLTVTDQVRADKPAPAGLSLPENLWCPECGIHARHQDTYGVAGGASLHTLMPRCPVCEDKRRRIKYGLEP